MIAVDVALSKIQEAVTLGGLSSSAAASMTRWLEKPPYSRYRESLLKDVEVGNWQGLEDAFNVLEVATDVLNELTMVESAHRIAESAHRIADSNKEDNEKKATEEPSQLSQRVRELAQFSLEIGLEMDAALNAQLQDDYREKLQELSDSSSIPKDELSRQVQEAKRAIFF